MTNILRRMLKGRDRAVALIAARSLSDDDLKAVLPELVDIARAAHGPFRAAWDLILRLPREWLLDHLPPQLDLILASEEDTDYWMFLNLARQIDRDLARQLARRAIQHADRDIQELGHDAEERLK